MKNLKQLEPRLCNGSYFTNKKLFDVIYHTNRHWLYWLYYDPFEHGTKAYKSAKQVRIIHSMVVKRTQNSKYGHNLVWQSQYGKFYFYNPVLCFSKYLAN